MLLYLSFIAALLQLITVAGVSISYLSPGNCSKGSANHAAEYLNTATFLCESCSQGITYQKQSADGLSCQCQPGYYIISHFGGNSLKCGPCGSEETVTDDGLYCVRCRTGAYSSTTKSCQACSAAEFSTYYSFSGELLSTQQCVSCQGNSTSNGTGCVPCPDTIRMLRASALTETCQCPNPLINGVCFPGVLPVTSTSTLSRAATDSSPVVPSFSSGFSQILPAGQTSSTNAISSYYLTAQAQIAAGFCSTAYANATACQVLANLCTLQLNTKVNIGSTSSSTCAQFLRIAGTRSTTRSGFTSWVTGMPWLYYSPTTGSSALKETSITQTYSPNALLDIRLAAFSLDGRYLGLLNAATGGYLQLCKESQEKMKAAFLYGTVYQQKLMPIPILNRALLNVQGQLGNVVSDSDASSLSEAINTGNSASAISLEANIQDKWELTRRFFLVDNVVGKADPKTNPSTLVRYASNIQIDITPRGSGADGLMYPPLLTVDYSNLYAANDYGNDKKVTITFSVTYTETVATEAVFDQNLRIAMGVMSALAVAYAIIRTWLWSRRAGVLRLDGMLVLKLLLFTAGNIANVFLIVIYGVSVYFLLFYKLQSVYAVTLPQSDQFLTVYIAAAFALKCVDLIHLLAVQCTVDIFFIDWEHPRLRQANAIQTMTKVREEQQRVMGDLDALENETYRGVKSAGDPKSQSDRKPEDTGISVWRRIYVANEWNEIQTYRKTQRFITYGCVLIVMHVIGFENLASTDSRSSFVPTDLENHIPQCRLFRIALILSTILIVGCIQWFLVIVLWEKCFEDKLRSFADLCTVTNISVFLLSQANFGYYIHGRSPTGRSDIDLGGLITMLAMEKDGVAPRRGITADSDDHTYRMALPTAMRKAFNRLYAPLLDLSSAGGPAAIQSPINMTTLDVYQAMNRFLIRFISRDDPDGLRYRIVKRKALEDVLDGEFDDTTFDGRFYLDLCDNRTDCHSHGAYENTDVFLFTHVRRDDGNSFGDVLYYGNELLLFVFDALLFCLVDLLIPNLILDATITLLVGTIFSLLRDDLGRRNLARKALIDERFLI
ncbi:unnamed protein product [Calicophoron daubneyi]|uniref:Meckelin n=1 Tax=Calicophoron daubneyi TaxID=300641 RepID=A0AAV2T152_CALDB